MSDLLLTMAKQASKDETMMASLIQEFSQYKVGGWDQVSSHLWIDQSRLAKLALCRRPRETKLEEDQAQIADYIGMDKKRFANFFEQLNVERQKSLQVEIAKKQNWKLQ